MSAIVSEKRKKAIGDRINSALDATRRVHLTPLFLCPPKYTPFLTTQSTTMDTDISDILASVSGPTTPQRTLDLQALTRAWVNERVAPELLPYPADLIDRIMGRIATQVWPPHASCRKGWRCDRMVAKRLLVDRNNRRPHRHHGPQRQLQARDHTD